MTRKSMTKLLAVLAMSAVSIAANAAPKYEPFPDGYGYMDQAVIDELKAAVDAWDHSKVRVHGWKL